MKLRAFTSRCRYCSTSGRLLRLTWVAPTFRRHGAAADALVVWACDDCAALPGFVPATDATLDAFAPGPVKLADLATVGLVSA